MYIHTQFIFIVTFPADGRFLQQAMLYAAGVPSREAMKQFPHVGVATVWWEGNPCKYETSAITRSFGFCFLFSLHADV